MTNLDDDDGVRSTMASVRVSAVEFADTSPHHYHCWHAGSAVRNVLGLFLRRSLLNAQGFCEPSRPNV